MFENLTERLNQAFSRLKGRGKLSEADIDRALREVRLALLEADVNYRVVKDFVARVKERALGQEVMESLTPAQQVIKIVHEELIRTLGDKASPLDLSGPTPLAIVLVGLQGSGKTTTAAKLARFLKRRGRNPYLVAADIYRPAAIEQLKTLGQSLGLPVFEPQPGQSPPEIARLAMVQAKATGRDIAIIDTAGRLHIDEALMEELKAIKEATSPKEILLVADAMTGQDAVNMAKAFDEAVGITGVILTKMEGDARGGAALSIRAVTGKPIKFLGTGEKLEALEIFAPDRIANRILGMGDILSLIEKAQETFDQKKALELQEKLRREAFTLEDLRDQIRQIKKMGPLNQLLSLIPGMSKIKNLDSLGVDGKEFSRMEAIINSMTPEERRNPRILNASRKRRIARGSGTSVQDVNRLLKNFAQMQKMLKRVKKKGLRGLPFGPGTFPF
ncbi:signal recognition particle protein [Thermosulfuriphilus ammonigenes]|uniref:Signal recognition particle protein n=1 Tax=Thermosulfuriphilus ammonigenes TaxID=1936021 RepID=A0A6G7PY10_9BACT|nr:signal recognition particle protein [Thermosulfuriphilus ammonigenes]MBA2849361.1 signal recognition particle subunit SRP54 [Thermosulfuriphilus ammonigenes]QIJ72436.1 signal recognition particle protein [Thermosulfuriphilus ammonigenes]